MTTNWQGQRRAAAWYIREGRRLKQRLHWANEEFQDHISRRDNNDQWEMGGRLIEIGRRIAMGYELETWTWPMYLWQLKATRPRRKKKDDDA